MQLLDAQTGPPRPAQLTLAQTVGLTLVGDEPHNVVAAMLEDHLRPIVWNVDPAPATDRQIQFLRHLTATTRSGLSKNVASAWIDHHLALKTRTRLAALQLKEGDAVIKSQRFHDPESGQPIEILDYCVVSSIGANGLVYFKGGNGNCGWPSTLRNVNASDELESYPTFRTAGTN